MKKTHIIIIIIYLLLAYSPVNRSTSPQGFSQVKFRTQVEFNTKHAHYINVKHTKQSQPNKTKCT